jgi:hypothetical protein
VQIVAQRRALLCRVAGTRQVHRVAESRSPEVVPVGVDRLREVALVADRFGQDAVARFPIARRELRPEALIAQRLEVVHRAQHGRPQLGEQRAIRGNGILRDATRAG